MVQYTTYLANKFITKTRISLLIIALTSFMLGACQAQTPMDNTSNIDNKTETKEVEMEETTPNKNLTTISGTVLYKSLEGGFWALTTKEGKNYTLKRLPKAYRRHGLIVKISGEALTDVMTITQFGTLFKVEQVTIINSNNVKSPATH